MNKYENLKFVIKKHIPTNIYSQDVTNDLLKLVKRATPTKILNPYVGEPLCPSCNEELDCWWNPVDNLEGGDAFCPRCGQALLWENQQGSEDNE